jgi:hypothetical protein
MNGLTGHSGSVVVIATSGAPSRRLGEIGHLSVMVQILFGRPTIAVLFHWASSGASPAGSDHDSDGMVNLRKPLTDTTIATR